MMPPAARTGPGFPPTFSDADAPNRRALPRPAAGPGDRSRCRTVPALSPTPTAAADGATPSALLPAARGRTAATPLAGHARDLCALLRGWPRRSLWRLLPLRRPDRGLQP